MTKPTAPPASVVVVGLFSGPLCAAGVALSFLASLTGAPATRLVILATSAALSIRLSEAFLGSSTHRGGTSRAVRIVHLVCGLAGASLVTVIGLFVLADAQTLRALLDGALMIAWATLLIAPAAVALIRVDLLDEDRSHARRSPWSRTSRRAALLFVLICVTTVSQAWRGGGGAS
jgi:hypothetical protein